MDDMVCGNKKEVDTDAAIAAEEAAMLRELEENDGDAAGD